MTQLTYKVLNIHFFKQCEASNSQLYHNDFPFIQSLTFCPQIHIQIHFDQPHL